MKEPTKWSPEFSDFLAKCLQKDPNARPTATELLNVSNSLIINTFSVVNLLIKQILVFNLFYG